DRQIGDVHNLELGVRQSHLLGLSSSGLYSVFGDVVAVEARVRELPRQDIHSVPGTAADVENADPSRQILGETFDCADETGHQLLLIDPPPDVVHALSKEWAVCSVGNTAASPKARNERW